MHAVVARIAYPQLGRDENICAVDIQLGFSSAESAVHRGFCLIERDRIDKTIIRFKRSKDRIFRRFVASAETLARSRLEGTETEQWQFDAVIEGD